MFAVHSFTFGESACVLLDFLHGTTKVGVSALKELGGGGHDPPGPSSLLPIAESYIYGWEAQKQL